MADDSGSGLSETMRQIEEKRRLDAEKFERDEQERKRERDRKQINEWRN